VCSSHTVLQHLGTVGLVTRFLSPEGSVDLGEWKCEKKKSTRLNKIVSVQCRTTPGSTSNLINQDFRFPGFVL
jgi:hypothetical protein